MSKSELEQKFLRYWDMLAPPPSICRSLSGSTALPVTS